MLRLYLRLFVYSVVVGLLHASIVRADATGPDQRPVIVVVGDSLSAGFGINPREGWVALLQRKLAAEGYGYRVVNASVSGETSGGGRARLNRILQRQRPAIVILELGGNDALRGLPVTSLRKNLATMIEASQASGAKLMLVGVSLSTDFGEMYVNRFNSTYRDLAGQFKVPLVSSFLEGVGTRSEWMQADGIHPNAAGQARLLANVWPTLQPLLGQPAPSRRL
jgi:acyl-CoA thioesterase-1